MQAHLSYFAFIINQRYFQPHVFNLTYHHSFSACNRFGCSSLCHCDLSGLWFASFSHSPKMYCGRKCLSIDVFHLCSTTILHRMQNTLPLLLWRTSGNCFAWSLAVIFMVNWDIRIARLHLHTVNKEVNSVTYVHYVYAGDCYDMWNSQEAGQSCGDWTKLHGWAEFTGAGWICINCCDCNIAKSFSDCIIFYISGLWDMYFLILKYILQAKGWCVSLHHLPFSSSFCYFTSLSSHARQVQQSGLCPLVRLVHTAVYGDAARKWWWPLFTACHHIFPTAGEAEANIAN